MSNIKYWILNDDLDESEPETWNKKNLKPKKQFDFLAIADLQFSIGEDFKPENVEY